MLQKSETGERDPEALKQEGRSKGSRGQSWAEKRKKREEMEQAKHSTSESEGTGKEPLKE